MIDFESKDIPNERYVDFGTNNRIKVSRLDPYGFWVMSFERGVLPNDLKGFYTTFQEAEKHFQAYVKRMGRTIKEVTT